MTSFNIPCTSCTTLKHYSTKRSYDTATYNLRKRGYAYCKECLKKHVSEKYKGKPNPSYKRNNSIKKFFKECPVCNKSQGYATEKILYENIRLNTMCNTCSGLIHKKGERLNNSLSPEKRLQMIATREGFSSYEEYQAKFKEFRKYHNKVRNLTWKQPIETLENFDKRALSGTPGGYQIDHIVTIHDGFVNNIPAKTIAHISNLRMITWEENIIKHKNSDPDSLTKLLN